MYWNSVKDQKITWNIIWWNLILNPTALRNPQNSMFLHLGQALWKILNKWNNNRCKWFSDIAAKLVTTHNMKPLKIYNRMGNNLGYIKNLLSYVWGSRFHIKSNMIIIFLSAYWVCFTIYLYTITNSGVFTISAVLYQDLSWNRIILYNNVTKYHNQISENFIHRGSYMRGHFKQAFS